MNPFHFYPDPGSALEKMARSCYFFKIFCFLSKLKISKFFSSFIRLFLCWNVMNTNNIFVLRVEVFLSIFPPLDPDPKHSNKVSKTKFLYCAKLIRTVEWLLSLFFQWSQKCAKNFKSIIIKTKEKTINCFLITMDINVLICRWQRSKSKTSKK